MIIITITISSSISSMFVWQKTAVVKSTPRNNDGRTWKRTATWSQCSWLTDHHKVCGDQARWSNDKTVDIQREAAQPRARRGKAATASRQYSQALTSTRSLDERPRRAAVNYKAPSSSGIIPRTDQHVTSQLGDLQPQCVVPLPVLQYCLPFCTVSHKRHPRNLFATTQSKLNRFSKFCHWQISMEMCRVTVNRNFNCILKRSLTNSWNLGAQNYHRTFTDIAVKG